MTLAPPSSISARALAAYGRNGAAPRGWLHRRHLLRHHRRRVLRFHPALAIPLPDRLLRCHRREPQGRLLLPWHRLHDHEPEADRLAREPPLVRAARDWHGARCHGHRALHLSAGVRRRNSSTKFIRNVTWFGDCLSFEA